MAMGHRNGRFSNTSVRTFKTQIRFKAFGIFPFSSTGDGGTLTEIADGNQRVNWKLE